MKRLLLIAPLAKSGLVGKDISFRFPCLGLLRLAALTPSGWEVTIVDEKIEPLDMAQSADVVGIILGALGKAQSAIWLFVFTTIAGGISAEVTKLISSPEQRGRPDRFPESPLHRPRQLSRAPIRGGQSSARIPHPLPRQ